MCQSNHVWCNLTIQQCWTNTILPCCQLRIDIMIIHSVPDCLHDARMSYYDAVIAILTILVSLALVIILVGAAWWLMWKVSCQDKGQGTFSYKSCLIKIQNETFSCFYSFKIQHFLKRYQNLITIQLPATSIQDFKRTFLLKKKIVKSFHVYKQILTRAWA